MSVSPTCVAVLWVEVRIEGEVTERRLVKMET